MDTQNKQSILSKAEARVDEVATSVANDANRPAYHFLPRCCWMNDPNGVTWRNGYYHAFYQFNPYSDESGDKYWGHTRSRDLVHWEHLPIALWPSLDQGEAQCWSGCLAYTVSGEPIIFYTSVAPDNERPFEQWAALGNDDLTDWRKADENPILSLDDENLPRFSWEWRDPFVFEAGGRTFMVLGVADEEQAHVGLFESEDPSLRDWRYRGVIYSQPLSQMRFCECPNFFPLDDKFMLLMSPYRNVEYTVGDFNLDTLTFTPLTSGTLDDGIMRFGDADPNGIAVDNANFYATNITYGPDGDCILFGWIRNFRKGQGWNGCLALPRLLTLGEDCRPRQQPVPELARLRDEQLADMASLTVSDTAQRLDGVRGDALELKLTVRLHNANSAGIYLRAADDHASGVHICYDGQRLRVGDTEIEYGAGSEVSLQIFLDRTVTEVFVDDGVKVVTNVAYAPVEDQPVWCYAEGGAAEFANVRAWSMHSIW